MAELYVRGYRLLLVTSGDRHENFIAGRGDKAYLYGGGAALGAVIHRIAPRDLAFIDQSVNELKIAKW